MRRKFLIVVLVGLLAVGLGLLLRGRVANAWIRDALSQIADVWLVPDLTIGGFSLLDPSTVALEDVALVGPDGRPLIEIDVLTVSLANVPREGEPLRIARLSMLRPVVYLRPDPASPGFVPHGWVPLLESDALADPSALAASVRPSEVLDLHHIDIEQGTLVIEDRAGDALRLDGIAMLLEADPDATPDGNAGHRMRLELGQAPGFVLSAGGHVDLDGQIAWVDALRVGIDLADPDAVARLSPAVRAVVEAHELRGVVDIEGNGKLALTDFLGSTLALSATLHDVHGATDDVRVPIEDAALKLVLEDRIVRLDEARARLLSGEISLTQADLALDEEGLALAADWTIDGLALGDLLRDPAPSAAGTLAGTGRVFLSQDDLSMGMVLDALSLTPPGEAPVFTMEKAVLRNLRLQSSGTPILVDALSIARLDVDLRGVPGRPDGWPIPAAGQPTEDPPAGAALATHWSDWFVVDWLEVSSGRLRLAPSGEVPWELRGIQGVLQGLGGDETSALTATLNQGEAAKLSARGAVDLREPSLYFTEWSFVADLGDARAQALLPPGVRSSLTSLLPAGLVAGSGTAHFPLGPPPIALGLDLSVSEGRLEVAGLRFVVSEGTARVDVANGATRVSDVVLAASSGKLRTRLATVDADGALSLGLVAEDLSLRRVTTMAGVPLGVGRLSGSATVDAQFTELEGRPVLGGLDIQDGALRVDAGPAGVLKWSSFSASLRPQGDHLRFAGAIAGSGTGGLSATGTMALGGDRLVLSELKGSVDLDAAGDRAMLPPTVQRAVASTTGILMLESADGVLNLDDPLGRSTARATVRLSDGSWTFGGYRLDGLSGALPVTFGDGALDVRGSEVRGLDGVFTLREGRWSLVSDAGRVRWSLGGLDLSKMVSLAGSPEGIGGILRGEGTVEVGVEGGELTVRGGTGEAHIIDGRLLAIPPFGAMKRDTSGETGDDQLDLRYRLGPRGVRFPELFVDLGPVRYTGAGEVRWTGGVDVQLEGGARPGERARPSDLAARLVAWNIRGTLQDPQMQALPLGIDTRTFDQVTTGNRGQRTTEGLPEGSVLGGAPEDALDEIPEATGGNLAPPPAFDDVRDLDDGEDDW